MPVIRSLCCLLCLYLGQVAHASAADAAWNLPTSERLMFSIRWSRLAVVDASFVLEPPTEGLTGPIQTLTVEAWTKSLPSRIYRVENHYETIIDLATGLPVRYAKRCDEARFQEHSATTYAQAEGWRRYTSKTPPSETTQELLGPTHNLFSALYFLRQHNFRTQVPVRFLLDAKGASWQAEARRRRNLRTKHGFVWEVAVRFTMIDGDPTARQSDLLTDNIVNGDHPLILHIRPPEAGTDEPPMVVHMAFRGGGFHLVADLDEDASYDPD